MRIFRTPSVGRTALLHAGLLLFLLGSNYCLVGALTGGSEAMACMSPRTDAHLPSNLAPEQKAEAAHASGKSCHGDGESSAMPCCIALAPVVSPKAASIGADDMVSLPIVLSENDDGVQFRTAPSSELPAPARVIPASALLRAPQSPRAPPLV